jgi:EmrB/QacA subfamily drug resistance transporter
VSGLALGPIVGGFIVEHWSWQWIFLINVPIGMAAFVLTALVVRESRDPQGDTAVDIPGTVTVSLAIGLLTYGLIEAGEAGWTSGVIVSSLLGSLAAFAFFIAIEQRVRRPMVPLALFRPRMFTGANLTVLVVSFLISGIAFTGTMYFQNLHDYSPVKTGLTMLPMVAVMMGMSPIVGGLVGRVPIRTLILIGLLITGSGALLYLRTVVSASYLDVLPAMLAIGRGSSFLFAPMKTGVMNSVPASQIGVGSAVNGAVRETGFAFGIAVLGALANRAYHHTFRESSDVQALREMDNPAIVPVLDAVRSGLNFAGNSVYSLGEGAQIPAPVMGSVRDVSSEAFNDGMHFAFVITGMVTIVAALGTWLLIGPDQPSPHPAGADTTNASTSAGDGVAPAPVAE